MSSGDAAPWGAGIVIGRYRLLRELARGGMGEVWLAVQTSEVGLEREVVIKRVLTTTQDEQSQVLFRDEARLLARMQHPNIVQLYDFGETGGSLYVVMERLDGETLARANRRAAALGLRLPAEACASVVQEAALGLGYAHRMKAADGSPLKVVHRDVSPQNVFLTRSGHVKVLDFGIALAEGRAAARTLTGEVKGKVEYLSPEQVMGERVDARTDVFALGVLLFEGLTGRRLHAELDTLQVLTRLLQGEPLPAPRDVDPSIPLGLDVITRRALSHDLGRRYRDGHELAQALAEWLRSPLADAKRADLEAFMQQLDLPPDSGATPAGQVTPAAPHAGEARAAETRASTPRAKQSGAAGTKVAAAEATEGAAEAGAVNRSALALATEGVAEAGAVKRSGGVGATEGAAELPPPGLAAHRAGRPGLALAVVGGACAVALLGGAISLMRPTPRAELGVAVEPSSATISVDGESCPAPCRRVVAPGRHQVRVASPMHREHQASLELAAGEFRSLQVALSPLEVHPPAPAAIVAAVPDAGNSADGGGASLDKSPVVVARGRLTLDTVPWTHVFLQGVELGITPLAERPVRAGKLTLRLVNDGEGVDQVVEFEVKPGATVVKKLHLTANAARDGGRGP